MKLLVGKKNSGKTTELIRRAAKTNSYIVCATYDIPRIEKLAQDLKIKIHQPIGYSEFIRGKYYGRNIESFCIDDITRFFQNITSVKVALSTIDEETLEFLQ